MSAEKVTTVGRTPSRFISSKISSALAGLRPFSQAEMAVVCGVCVCAIGWLLVGVGGMVKRRQYNEMEKRRK